MAALNALPSMCIGRSPEEALDLMLDALPTILDCELLFVALPGAPPLERGTFRGQALSQAQLDAVRARDPDASELLLAPSPRALLLADAEVPLRQERGCLLVGRSAPFESDTDRVLVRTAANLLGTTLESARVLDAAHRKDDFLAMLGHELRNPLAPIVTAVELLAKNRSASRERAIIERHARHLVRLVDDLLDISRVTRGLVELRSERVPLTAVLDRAVEMAAPLVVRYRHVLRIDKADGVAIQGDPVRLAQVFGNLLTNAAKFTPPGGAIDVTITRAPQSVRVSVRDSGRGIRKDQLRRIFESFVQIDRERDRLSGGLGLGLAIASRLVERHGGAISVESPGVEHGSTFHVDLPTVPAADEAAVPRAVASPIARAGVRVLVVDDNVDIAELVSEALRDEGFETAVAHDAQTALATWRTFAPHAAVLDVGLPEMDGYDLAKALRAEHGRAPILIAATGYGQTKDRVLSSDAGFDCHFVKPVSIQDIIVALDERVVAPRTHV